MEASTLHSHQAQQLNQPNPAMEVVADRRIKCCRHQKLVAHCSLTVSTTQGAGATEFGLQQGLQWTQVCSAPPKTIQSNGNQANMSTINLSLQTMTDSCNTPCASEVCGTMAHAVKGLASSLLRLQMTPSEVAGAACQQTPAQTGKWHNQGRLSALASSATWQQHRDVQDSSPVQPTAGRRPTVRRCSMAQRPSAAH